MATFGRRDGSYAVLEASIPELDGWDYEVTSEPTPEYNCIAYAAGVEDQFWWPLDDESAYWPVGAPLECTVEAFVQAYASIGYTPCDDDSFDPTYDKIALYIDGRGKPAHAAIQVDGLYWRSKCGSLHDIKHPLGALDGPTYGRVALFLRRPRSSPPGPPGGT